MLRVLVLGVLILCVLFGSAARAAGPEPISELPPDIEARRMVGVAAAKSDKPFDALEAFVTVYDDLVELNRVSCAVTINIAHVLLSLDQPKKAYLFYWKTRALHDVHGERCGRKFSEENLNWIDAKLEELATGFEAEGMAEFEISSTRLPPDPTRNLYSQQYEACTLRTKGLEGVSPYPRLPERVFLPAVWWFKGDRPSVMLLCGDESVAVRLEAKGSLPDGDADALLGTGDRPITTSTSMSGARTVTETSRPKTKRERKAGFAFWKQPGFWLASAGVISVGVGAGLYVVGRGNEQDTIDTFWEELKVPGANPLSDLVDRHHPQKITGTWMMGLGVSAAVIGGAWLIAEGVRWKGEQAGSVRGALRSLRVGPTTRGLVLGFDVGF